MRVLPMGPTAVLLDELGAPPASVGEAVRRLRLDGVVDIVPAAETVLITVDRPEDVSTVLDALPVVEHEEPDERRATPVEIPVVYDGEDLAEVAARTGLSIADVIERHAGAGFSVAFCGFAPGFAYLDGLPPELHLARRATPRTRVPAGSVAIAAGFSAVYPTASPGGWHLIGRTDAVLFDVHADPPARLTPGVPVRFVPR